MRNVRRMGGDKYRQTDRHTDISSPCVRLVYEIYVNKERKYQYNYMYMHQITIYTEIILRYEQYLGYLEVCCRKIPFAGYVVGSCKTTNLSLII
jgi:hypothetical protein